MHNVKFSCKRITTEVCDHRSRDIPECINVCAHGVFEASLFEALRQFDPKDVVRQIGVRALLEHIDEGEAKKHYGWT